MRSNLTLILIIVAILVSVAAGLAAGGGGQVWLSEPNREPVTNENITLPLVPAKPTPFDAE
jgi:hypothetical protein